MIDYENKFIFIHIPKTAGSSMNKTIKASNENASFLYNTHAPAETIKEALGDNYCEYFTFAFVRNPWDRLFSMYKFYNMRHGEEILKFDEWVFEDQFTLACGFQNPTVSIRKKPQCDWLFDNEGNMIIDFIGRFENLENDFKTVSKKCNIALPLIKSQMTGGESYKYTYNNITHDFVEKYFREDIEMFNYKF